MPVSPLPRWGRDRHGFLCVIGCDEHFWRLLRVGETGIERMCKSCARDLQGLNASEVWAPRLPAVHEHIAFPGLLPDEPRDNLLQVQWNGNPEKFAYVMGDANAFMADHGWMGMTADNEGSKLAGAIETPTLDVSGKTTRPGHQFAWTAMFSYDPSPEGWRKSPYGFRLVTGTLSSAAGVSTFDDAFRMLDTIAVGTRDGGGNEDGPARSRAGDRGRAGLRGGGAGTGCASRTAIPPGRWPSSTAVPTATPSGASSVCSTPATRCGPGT